LERKSTANQENLMTAEQYNLLAPTYDRNKVMMEQEIDRIPMNINRAGSLYRKKLKEIINRYA